MPTLLFSVVLQCKGPWRSVVVFLQDVDAGLAVPIQGSASMAARFRPASVLERDGDPATPRRVESEDLKRERETGTRISKRY
jgi:hypothetical protein